MGTARVVSLKRPLCLAHIPNPTATELAKIEIHGNRTDENITKLRDLHLT